jgi:outer membrane lipoprotein-sorting protein
MSSKNKSGPFVGSEFAYEDITGQELEKYDYLWLRTEACGNLTCEVIERRPRYENSGYIRHIEWIDTVNFQPRKIEFHDRKDELLKTQTFENYKLYENKYWRPKILKMNNHQTNKSTELRFFNYEFGLGLTENDFVKEVLARTR